jgi:hypothetical protein
MPDPDHDDEQLPVPDGVDDSIPAHPDTVPIALPGRLLATRWPRIIGQRTDAGHDVLTVLLFVNGLDLLGRGRLDKDLISSHAA